MTNFEQYVEALNADFSYKYGIGLRAVSLPDSDFGLAADVNDDEYGGYAPTITFTTELDSDGESQYIYFWPVLEFPIIDSSELNFGDSTHYILDRWEALGRWVKEMIEYPYEIDGYYGYDDDEEI